MSSKGVRTLPCLLQQAGLLFILTQERSKIIRIIFTPAGRVSRDTLHYPRRGYSFMEISMNGLVKVEVVNGKPCVTSLQVADAFGKERFHVMRDIRETIAKCSKAFAETNFGLNSYSA